MENILKRPFRATGSGGKKFLSILAFGLFIFLFLFLFKPFGISDAPFLNQLLITFGYGLITFFVLLIFKFLLEPIIAVRKWTLGKEMLWDLLMAVSIGVVNYFYSSLILNLHISFTSCLYFIWTAILVGSIPVTIYLILEYKNLYHVPVALPDIGAAVAGQEPEIIITAGVSSNNVRTRPGQIVYICSNDNYVTIVTIGESQPLKTTIRGTLKKVEEELHRKGSFIRCHKCYIVNLQYVDSCSGNSQNLRLKLKAPGCEIPVARSKASFVIKAVNKY
ncbi:MAG TPA: LytTR family DNA-binding domain-containing protein [Bacteroidales bacterium]|nr:LytTR family DNA-binding domain-containing protein [Bacteroidales bacterium]